MNNSIKFNVFYFIKGGLDLHQVSSDFLDFKSRFPNWTEFYNDTGNILGKYEEFDLDSSYWR